jgi:predicted TIM-barrel fold metal-dependent hydrolase
MTVVDIHPHGIAADHARYPLVPVDGTLSEWARKRPVTCEGLLAAMDAAGVDQAVLVQPSTAHGFDNRYTADSAAAHPGRLSWVGTLDALAPETPDQLTYWVRERGMGGLRVFTAGSTIAGQAPGLGDPASFPTWARVRELEIPVSVQMRPEGVPRLLELIARYPDVPMILDHFGRAPLADGPPYAEAAPLFALAAHPNIYVKLTTHLYHEATHGQSTPRALLARLVETFGSERLAWGSNFPASEGALCELVALAREWVGFLPAADQGRILGETALGLYPALASGV